MLASKRSSSPGLLCGHRAPLLSGGSQRCSALGCLLPAGRSPAHGTAPLGRPVDRDGKGRMGCFAPIPRVPQERPATPNELCDVDTTYGLQTWARTAPGCGQAILSCLRRWRQGGETWGSWQPVVGPGKVQGPQKCPALSASAPRLRHGAGTSWGFAAKKQAGVTLESHTCTRSWDMATCPSSHHHHGIQKDALAWT